MCKKETTSSSWQSAAVQKSMKKGALVSLTQCRSEIGEKILRNVDKISSDFCHISEKVLIIDLHSKYSFPSCRVFPPTISIFPFQLKGNIHCDKMKYNGKMSSQINISLQNRDYLNRVRSSTYLKLQFYFSNTQEPRNQLIY